MRHITKEGLELIKQFEGFEPEVYLDAAGYPTIGYGHLIRKEFKQSQSENKKFKLGICCEHGDDKSSITFFTKQNSTKCNTLRIVSQFPE